MKKEEFQFLVTLLQAPTTSEDTAFNAAFKEINLFSTESLLCPLPFCAWAATQDSLVAFSYLKLNELSSEAPSRLVVDKDLAPRVSNIFDHVFAQPETTMGFMESQITKLSSDLSQDSLGVSSDLSQSASGLKSSLDEIYFCLIFKLLDNETFGKPYREKLLLLGLNMLSAVLTLIEKNYRDILNSHQGKVPTKEKENLVTTVKEKTSIVFKLNQHCKDFLKNTSGENQTILTLSKKCHVQLSALTPEAQQNYFKPVEPGRMRRLHKATSLVEPSLQGDGPTKLSKENKATSLLFVAKDFHRLSLQEKSVSSAGGASSTLHRAAPISELGRHSASPKGSSSAAKKPKPKKPHVRRKKP